MTSVSRKKIQFCDYRTLNKKTWTLAVITEVLGSRIYLIKFETGEIWKRHLDQLLKAAHNNDCTFNLCEGLDLSVNETQHNRIPTIISYKDDDAVQPHLPATLEKQSISNNDHRNDNVGTTTSTRSSKLRKKPDCYSP